VIRCWLAASGIACFKDWQQLHWQGSERQVQTLSCCGTCCSSCGFESFGLSLMSQLLIKLEDRQVKELDFH